jgi:hypothetical protein
MASIAVAAADAAGAPSALMADLVATLAGTTSDDAAGGDASLRARPFSLAANTWLPPALARAAEREEPRRFSLLVRMAQAEAAKKDWPRLLLHLAPLRSLAEAKTPLKREDVADLALLLHDSVIASAHDVEACARLAESLAFLLREHRRDRALQSSLKLPWRPLYALARSLQERPPHDLQAAGLLRTRLSNVFEALWRARRHFPQGSAKEVWLELAPDLRRGGDASIVACGWLHVLMPTKQLSAVAATAGENVDKALDVEAMLAEWLDLWDGVAAGSGLWDACWMSLFARAAKDDAARGGGAVVGWMQGAGGGNGGEAAAASSSSSSSSSYALPPLRRLYVHILSAFHVPVGTALARAPIGERPEPREASALVLGPRGHAASTARGAAKLALHLLKQQPLVLGVSSTPATQQQQLDWGGGGNSNGNDSDKDEKEEPATAGAAAAAGALLDLVAAVEQYAHPSNAAPPYAPELAQLVRRGTHALMKQLGKQAGPGGWPSEPRLAPCSARRFARALLVLCARGQFARDPSLSAACWRALCQLAHVIPSEALPLVAARFSQALEASGSAAAGALPAAAGALAACVRPLVLAAAASGGRLRVRLSGAGTAAYGVLRAAAADGGGGDGEEDNEGGAAAAAVGGTDDAPPAEAVDDGLLVVSPLELLAEAMKALVPALDANDMGKTASAFQFFNAVFASLPALRGTGDEPSDYDVSAAAGGGGESDDEDDGDDEDGGDEEEEKSGGAAGGAGKSSPAAPPPPPPPPELPLYVDDWLDALLERLLDLIGNLESAVGSGGLGGSAGDAAGGGSVEALTSSATSPLSDSTAFAAFCPALLSRLGPARRRRVAEAFARFLLAAPRAGVLGDAAVLARAAAGSCPALAARAIAAPLAKRAVADLKAAQRGGPAATGPASSSSSPPLFFDSEEAAVEAERQVVAAAAASQPQQQQQQQQSDLTRAQQEALAWSLSLAGAAAGQLPPALVRRRLLPLLLEAADLGFAANSRAVQNWAAFAVAALLSTLTSWRLAARWSARAPVLVPRGGGGGGSGGGEDDDEASGGAFPVCAWVDREGRGFRPLPWRDPSTEDLTAAAAIVERYLERPASALRRGLCSNGGGGGNGENNNGSALLFTTSTKTGRQRLLALVCSVSAVLVGLGSKLPEFQGMPGAGGGGGGGGGGGDINNNNTAINPLSSFPTLSPSSLAIVGAPGPATIGRPGARNRAAVALAATLRACRGDHREAAELALAGALVLLVPGVGEAMAQGPGAGAGGGGASGGGAEGAATGASAGAPEEPAAAACLLRRGFGVLPDGLAGEEEGDDDGDGGGDGSGSGGDDDKGAHNGGRSAGHSDELRAPRWRKRSPLPSVADRVRKFLLWRASSAAQCSHFFAVGGGDRQLPVLSSVVAAAAAVDDDPRSGLPREYLLLLRECAALSQWPNRSVRATAAPALTQACSRFPQLARELLPLALASMAGVELPAILALGATAAARGDDGGVVADAGTGLAAVHVGSGLDAPCEARAAALEAFLSRALRSNGAAASEPQPAPPAATTTAAGEESATDGRVSGACAFVTASIDALRLLSRDPVFGPAGVRAAVLAAARSSASPAASRAIGSALAQVMTRLRLPPGISRAEAMKLRADLVAAGAPPPPGAAVSVRATVVANAALVTLLSAHGLPLDGGGGGSQEASDDGGSGDDAEVAAHLARLLTTEASPLLRAVGGAGLWLMALPPPPPQAAAAAGAGASPSSSSSSSHQQRRAAAARAACSLLERDGGAARLLRLLAADHARLDAAEAARDKRGGGGGGGGGRRLLGGAGGGASEAAAAAAGALAQAATASLEALLSRLVAAGVERVDSWASGCGGQRAAALREGLFEAGHARLGRLLAASALAEGKPELVRSALEGPLGEWLDKHPQPTGATEKAEAATVVEVLAGVVSVGVGCCGKGGGGNDSNDDDWALALLRRGLATATTEMAEAWCAALRFSVSHLLATAAEEEEDKGGEGESGGALSLLAFSRGTVSAAPFDGWSSSGASASASTARATALRALAGVLAAVLAAPGALSPRRASSGGGSSVAAAAAAATAAPSSSPQPSNAKTALLPAQQRRLKYVTQVIAALRGATEGVGAATETMMTTTSGGEAAAPSPPKRRRRLPACARAFYGHALAELAAALGCGVDGAGVALPSSSSTLREPVGTLLALCLAHLRPAFPSPGAQMVRAAAAAAAARAAPAGVAAPSAPATMASRGSPGSGSGVLVTPPGGGGDDGEATADEAERQPALAAGAVAAEAAVLGAAAAAATAALAALGGGELLDADDDDQEGGPGGFALLLEVEDGEEEEEDDDDEAAGGAMDVDATAAPAVVLPAPPSASSRRRRTPPSVARLRTAAGALASLAVAAGNRACATVERHKGATVVAGAAEGGQQQPQQQPQPNQQRRSDGSEEDAVMVSAADAAADEGGNGNGNGNNGNSGNSSDDDESVARAGAALSFFVASFAAGDVAECKPWLVSLLPGILRVQELRARQLQSLASDARAAFLLAKYLPLLAPSSSSSSSPSSSSPGCAACCAAAGAAVLAAARSPYWSTRGSASVLLGLIWFRNQSALPAVGVEEEGGGAAASSPSLDDALRSATEAALRDPKAEVRAVASGTLSGMLRGRRGERAASALREALARRAVALWGGGAGGGSSGGGGGGLAAAASGRPPLGPTSSLEQQQQAVVQGLKALLLSAPYEVPIWAGQVLGALARGAGSRRAPAAVKREAAAALAEFRRTHDADECRQVLGEEAWESVVSVSAQSSYFA